MEERDRERSKKETKEGKEWKEVSILDARVLSILILRKSWASHTHTCTHTQRVLFKVGASLYLKSRASM